jgi:hypothetical protein
MKPSAATIRKHHKRVEEAREDLHAARSAVCAFATIGHSTFDDCLKIADDKTANAWRAAQRRKDRAESDAIAAGVARGEWGALRWIY